MTTVSYEQLREMAQHRGLKLVKSRRRKPGVGDFGKYGLTDEIGNALLGIGDDELTATADDILNYLRSTELSTWEQSAAKTPNPPLSRKRKRLPRADQEAALDGRPSRSPGRLARHRSGPGRCSVPESPPAKSPPNAARRLVREVDVGRRSKRKLAPKPVLRVRKATRADAGALADLLSQLTEVAIDEGYVADRLAVVRKAKGGMVVADLDGIIGCCGWAVVPTVHRGAIGRLTVLIVAQHHRRIGTGTALLAAAEKMLAEAGCCQIEAISDITVNNSHNFFRSLRFEQASYRFLREIDGQT
jgi:N-acetylglutamate synthase-like GNAT family acetyltransferase